MISIIAGGLTLLALYLLVDNIKSFLLKRKFNCRNAYYVNDGWFGFKTFLLLLQNDRNGTSSENQINNFETVQKDTFQIRMLGSKKIVTRDPENIKAMLSTQFDHFGIGHRYGQLKPLLGEGIFTVSGEKWKHSRAMLRPQFTREQISHVQMLEPHIQNLKKHIMQNSGNPFDIQELLLKFTIDTSSDFLYGESCNSLLEDGSGLNGGVKFKSNFHKSFDYVGKFLRYRAIANGFYFLVDNSKFRDSIKSIHHFADYYVKKALEMPPEELEKATKNKFNLLFELVKETRDPKVLRDLTLNILLAGRSTTAALISFCLYQLARNPDIWLKLRTEIKNSFGSDEEGDSRIQDITFESLKKCEYLRAVINETLRLHPSAPNNYRMATRDTTLPRGGGKDEQSPLLVRKGEIVLYSAIAMHNNSKIYGESFREFKPDRWFTNDAKHWGWSYLPFNGGPRVCLGQQFALTEASYVIARICMMFSQIESFESRYPPLTELYLVMFIKNHNNIVLRI
ncbi:cytochrome P450-dit2 [Scheffersomyces spartinae]|uniref:Cytochrome P450-dit2 n=1 Tax=Scheffersomyces spartinae TaxID=45513 RepID=A0A9P7VAT2_9ASCO|nr:cytochrome P450-dit2 [Scheffersomyces spartinae]KAG7194558.1 cytochrome P450-dit2 [Scheffersomyces spartinae]